MTLFVLAMALLFIEYCIGYYMGRKQIIDEIRQIVKELRGE